MPRTIDELLAANLDRAAIPMDADGAALFTAANPGVISDPLTQTILDEMDDHNHGTHVSGTIAGAGGVACRIRW